MKQTLLFLVFMMAFFFSFSQSSEKKIEEMELQQLDEVILVGYSTSTKIGYCGGAICIQTEIIETSPAEKLTLLYPNQSPAGLFNLKFTKDYKMVTVNVYTMTGQFIQSEKMKSFNRNISIDLSQFPKGIYLLELIADGVKLPTKKAVFR